MASPVSSMSTGAQIGEIQAIAAQTNAINMATMEAKLSTLGPKNAKDIPS